MSLLDQAADIVADDLAKNLVHHRVSALAANVIAELHFDSAKCCAGWLFGARRRVVGIGPSSLLTTFGGVRLLRLHARLEQRLRSEVG